MRDTECVLCKVEFISLQSVKETNNDENARVSEDQIGVLPY
jgi:hypothetical protein